MAFEKSMRFLGNGRRISVKLRIKNGTFKKAAQILTPKKVFFSIYHKVTVHFSISGSFSSVT